MQMAPAKGQQAANRCPAEASRAPVAARVAAQVGVLAAVARSSPEPQGFSYRVQRAIDALWTTTHVTCMS